MANFMFTHGKASCHLPPRIKLEKVDALAQYPVAIVFPKHQNFGRFFFVEADDRFTGEYQKMIAEAFGDPVGHEYFTWKKAVIRCVEDFLFNVSDNMVFRWRLFINGRAYGPVVTQQMVDPGRYKAYMGGFASLRIHDRKVVENVLYWHDMDEGLYGQFEKEA